MSAKNIRFIDSDRVSRFLFRGDNNTAYVEKDAAGTGTLNDPNDPYPTINAAVNAVSASTKGTIVLGPGQHVPTGIINTTKDLTILGYGESTELDLSQDINFSANQVHVQGLKLVNACVMTIQAGGKLRLSHVNSDTNPQIIASGLGSRLVLDDVELNEVVVQNFAKGTGRGRIATLTVEEDGDVAFNGDVDYLTVKHNGKMSGYLFDLIDLLLEGDTDTNINFHNSPLVTINEGGSGTGNASNKLIFDTIDNITGNSNGDNFFEGKSIIDSDVFGRNDYKVSQVTGTIDNSANPEKIFIDSRLRSSGSVLGNNVSFKGSLEVGATLTKTGSASYVEESTGSSIVRSASTTLAIVEPKEGTPSPATAVVADTKVFTVTPGTGQKFSAELSVPKNFTSGRKIFLQFNFFTTAIGGSDNNFDINIRLNRSPSASSIDGYIMPHLFPDSLVSNTKQLASLELADLNGLVNATLVLPGDVLTATFTENTGGTNPIHFDTSSFKFIDG